MENLEKYLLEEVVEKKEEIKKLKEENQNLQSGLNAFRGVLVSVVRKWKNEESDVDGEKKISFGPISSETDKELYEVLEGFARELGAIPNE